ncbi:DNA polymerase III, beta subunit [Treponema primitia ZAS-2]|uniref:Beta sliding clamp n=1 Tax=Treponema primitia (strain ATCC BAA-887 / DSM 12427 / ZAS-2) TaxID=545694 RepID=F5YLH2_TREPZ|nr:DNA polymerase III subunit beta [Treponema primitia]AEF83611.1 DNA polymerase III, beta subunit [Treponema primitia ZAS-2]
MKFTCERSILLKEIAIAQEIISSKNAISILSNIYLEAENDSLIIKATNIKVNFETRVPVMVEEAGSTTVFGEKFLGILNSIPDGELEFDQKDMRIIIKPTQRKIKFQLKSIASDKFPEFPVPNNNDAFDLPVKDFKEMIQQTVFAVSDDETRYFMNGVFFEKQTDKLIMVATDGRRLAYIDKPVGANIKDFAGIIVPPKILNTIMRWAGDEGFVSISITDKIIFIQFGSYQLSSVLIEGQFPNYHRVIPESQSYSFSMNRLEMLDALKRVSLLVEQKSRRVYLGVSPGLMSISSEESDIGTAKEEIPCKYEGEDVSMALNYRYIEEPLKVMSEVEISVHFTEPNKVITIKPAPEKDFFHILMPMQLD